MGIFILLFRKSETNIKLSDSINKAYIINQKRYNSTNYLFVLTDGLYEKIKKIIFK